MSERRISLRRLATATVMTAALASMAAAPMASAATASAATTTVVTAPAAVGASSATLVGAKKYTMTQVKKHKTAGNCWSVVGKNVYNLTGWVKKHPGGSSVIIAMCGKNGTAAYTGKHAGDSRAARALSGYKVGTL
jgi:cytochrome b involved in lipid metabolism